MRQLALIRFTGFLALILIVGIAGCGGGGTSTTPTTTSPTITVAPATLSLNFGQVVQLTTTMRDANGSQVFTPTPVYSSSDTNNVTVSTNGLVCAGTWDSLTTPVVCKLTNPAGQPLQPVNANITVTAGSLTATVPVSTHSRIARVTLTTTTAGCTSQTATQQFSAHAFDSSGTDITAQAGTFTFASADTTVATIDAASGLATSVMPGSTAISASVNGIFSLPATFVACPPASIVLSPATFTGAAGASQQLTATVTDTNGNVITGAALTYSTSQPAVASVTSAGLISAVAAGSAGIIASCTPPSCNPGANIPVYSNLVSASVTGTSATTVYVTGAKSTTIVPIDTGANVAGTAITVPLVNSVQPVINSMVFGKLGSKLYIGTDQGLLVLDTTANTIATPIAVPGNVLAVSPDGKKVIVADQTPTAPRTFIVDTASSGAFSLGISTISTAADFSPDSLKAYIVSNSSPTLTVYSPAFPTKVLTISAPANDVTFLTQGSLGYLAGGSANSITARPTCDPSSALTNPVATAATPLRISSSFDSTRVFAIDGTRMYDVTVSNIATAPSTNCPVTATNSLNTVSFGNTFTPTQLIVTSDASRAFVTNNLNKLMVYNSTNSTASTITLLNSATSSTTGGATLDHLQLYVGTLGSNDVHRIDIVAGTDAQQIAVGLKDSAGAATSPDFVAVRPK